MKTVGEKDRTYLICRVRSECPLSTKFCTGIFVISRAADRLASKYARRGGKPCCLILVYAPVRLESEFPQMALRGATSANRTTNFETVAYKHYLLTSTSLFAYVPSVYDALLGLNAF